MSVEHFNPPLLHDPAPGIYSHVSRTRGGVNYRFAGQVAVDADGRNVAIGDLAGQIRACYECVRKGLDSVGLDWSNITHLLIFTTDIAAYVQHQPGVVHAIYGGDPPPSTLVEVRRLAHPDWLVEIQADAVGS